MMIMNMFIIIIIIITIGGPDAGHPAEHGLRRGTGRGKRALSFNTITCLGQITNKYNV